MSEFLRKSDNLTRSIVEYKKNPFSPEANTNYWRTKLQEDGRRIGLEIFVPDCNWTEEEIKKPMLDINEKEISSMLVYIPS